MTVRSYGPRSILKNAHAQVVLGAVDQIVLALVMKVDHLKGDPVPSHASKSSLISGNEALLALEASW